MPKLLLFCLALLTVSLAASAEEGGEHEAKKPPPKPPAGSPASEVMKLQAIIDWKQWEAAHKRGNITAWGEDIATVDGQKCWGVALGEMHDNGVHVWRHFCVPQSGGDIWVGSIPSHPDDEIAYTPYGKWVTDCKPTASYPGSC